MKVFILNFYVDWWQSPEYLYQFLDTQPFIKNWMALPPSIFICSDRDAHTLSDLISKELPEVWFFLAEIDQLKSNGFLSTALWDFINSPRPNEAKKNPVIPSINRPSLGLPPIQKKLR